jgi:hypothetical protein
MIINETVSSPVLSNVAAAPTRFKIKASAKAFKILSGFYSEPILAIPRELGANAWDSHVKACNTAKMFEVHAPNTLEPWFAIRDFGTGLTPEAIDTIYTTYFESTKTADNDSDGCMGLGSKTPFNYTENFNVTSFHNGNKYVYNCFIDEQGAPNIMHIATQDTTEHNGLEIKFGVKISDVSMWVDKISRAYEPFRYRPTIVGAKIEYKPREYIYQGKNWAIRKDNGYYTGCNAFMGNYCYPINVNAMRSALNTMGHADAYTIERALNSGGFDLFFEIGQLDVAPNKEQLQYGDNNLTTLAVINATKSAIAELKDQVMQKIEKPNTLWEAMKLYSKYNGYESSHKHIRHIIGGDIPIYFNNVKVNNGNESVINTHKNAKCLASDGTLPTYRLYILNKLDGKIKATTSYISHFTNDVHVFYTHHAAIKKARLRHHLKQKYSGKEMLICYIVVDESAHTDTFWKHAKYFGWNDSMITDIDTLPKPPATPRQKKVVGTDEIFYADISGYFNPSSRKYLGSDIRWRKKSATFDSNNTYYYLDFYYSDPVYNDTNLSEVLHSAVALIADNKLIDDVTIYGINMKNKSILKVGKWVNVMDIVKQSIVSNKVKYEQELYVSSQYQNYRTLELQRVYGRLTSSPSIISNIKNENTRNMLTAFIKAYKATEKETSVDVKLLNLLGVNAVKHANLDIDASALLKYLDTKYFGLFNVIDTYNREVSAIYKIINFIDEKS